MRFLLIFSFLLAFSSFGQEKTITFKHNDYLFVMEVDSIVHYFQIEEDSISKYENMLIENLNRKLDFTSDTIIEFGQYVFYTDDLLSMIEKNPNTIRILRESNKKMVKFKFKTRKVKIHNQGIGGSSKTFLVLIDRKNRKEIARSTVSRNVGC
jgi:hypothetical protein